MESSLFSKEKRNRLRKKVIPWHVQQRYMESLSQLSLNQTITTAFYKKKIKSLQRNNKHLALALQRSRYLATDKENLLIDNGKNLDILNFSRLKLMDVAINMKQATECLDETLLLLNSSIADNLTKHASNNVNYRNDFKNKLLELTRNSLIEEVSENSDSTNVKSCGQKGKISRVDGYSSSPNKKCKLAQKGGNVKRNCKDMPKTATESLSAASSIGSKNAIVKNSKSSSALNIKHQNRKKSLPRSSNIELASSSKLPTTNSNLFLRPENKQGSSHKKQKTLKVILTDIAETVITQETENHHSPETYKLTSFTKSTQNPSEKDILIKKKFFSEINSKEKVSSSNSCGSQKIATINDKKLQNYSQNASNSSYFPHNDLPSSDDNPGNNELSVPSSERNEDFVYIETDPVTKKKPNKKSDNVRQNNRKSITNIDSERDKKLYKPLNTKVINRVQFYFDEDAIEKVNGRTVSSMNKIQKSINKCKARKTYSNVKKIKPSKKTPLNSTLILPDNVSTLGKNSFVVTAEIHSPPNGIFTQETKSKACATKKMEPCVVLTDIFKNNKGLLSEMVGNGLRENGCLQNTITNSAEAPLATFTVNGLNATYVGFENNTENRCLPEDKESIKKRERRRTKIVSYKEPPLHVKMRRLF